MAGACVPYTFSYYFLSQRSNGAWVGRKAKPLILAAEKRHTFLVVGVVPSTSEVSMLNL